MPYEKVPKLTTYCFSKLLPQGTLYTALLNFQYPFHSVEQLLEAALQFHLRCYLAENKYTGSVTMHEAHLKANSQEKKEFCPMYGHQQRNKKELSCELGPKKTNRKKLTKDVFIINTIELLRTQMNKLKTKLNKPTILNNYNNKIL